MKNNDSVPLENGDNLQEEQREHNNGVNNKSSSKKEKEKDKKKKKLNLWPLKALIISFFLAASVNALSELTLKGAEMWLAILLTVIILILGVLFDMIGTAATSCDVEPFLAMASRKVKGAKTAVKLSKKSHIVSSVCCDIVGDICGIVSGICAASIAMIAVKAFTDTTVSFIVSVLIYAVISMLTITLKATGKSYAVNYSNKIIFGVAKFLSIFTKNG